MIKEYWLMQYERAISNICKHYDIDIDKAIITLENILDENPRYLDDYVGAEIEEEE